MTKSYFKSYKEILTNYYLRFVTVFLITVLGLISTPVKSQQYPVKLVPVVIPPYSLKIGDYSTSTDNKLQLQVLMTDLLEPQHQTGIKFSLEAGLNAVPLARSNDFIVGMNPFMLYPGNNVTLTNVDLRSLFELQNLSGINAVQYSKPLSDGVYQFCFQAYDYFTKNNLSAKTCATVFMVQYDPPMLTLPQNAEKVQALSPYSGGAGIVFQWMPRQIAPNTKYIFTLKELWDQGQSPISGFLSAPPLWTEETYAPTLYYGIDKTQLIPGKRYAWQVQSKSGNPVLGANPTDDNGVYKNNGLSEIFYFDYVENCAVPTLLMAKNVGRGRVELQWSIAGQPAGLYNVQYRKKGSTAEWVSQQSYQASAILTGLEDQTEYEYRIGSVCGNTQTFNNTNPFENSNSGGNAYSYSGIQYFTTDANDVDNNYQCGIMPAIDIANKTPLNTQLGNNEVFMAGDFPVTVLSAQGSGVYTGTGYIEVPYLADTKIKVSFNNIKLNTDKKLIEGVIETTYDPNESAVHYASGGLGETFGDAGVKDVTVNYVVTDIKYTATPPPGKITVYGDFGTGGTPSQQDFPGGKDYQIKDKEGNIWTVDENGNVTKVGKEAEGGASTSSNTEGVTGSGNTAAVNQYTAKGVKIEWKEDANGKFAYDTADKTKLPKSKYPSVKDTENNTVYVPYKATVNKQTELFDAKVTITDPTLKDAKIIFKTLSLGKAIEAIELNKTDTERNYQLKLPGTFDYAEEEVIAVLMPKESTGKQQIISNFRLVHLSPKTVNVSLVPLDANSQSKLQAQGNKINQIYNKIGVNFTVKEEPVLDISSIVSGNTIGSEDSDLMSTYSPQQQQINALFKTTYDRYVLFVTNKTSSTGQNGYMRLNGQFGYVYNNAPQKTGAHELGHGVFKLEHPWKAYQTTKGATDLLTDYSTGEELSHLDWKQVNDPAFKLYAFQGQSSGEFTDIQLTPEWEPFKFTGSNIYISGNIKSPNGAVHGIAMCKNDSCSETENYFWINDAAKKGYYAEGKSTPLTITYLTQQEKDKNPATTLFWNYGSCGYNKTYTTSWNYIKDKKGFDLTQVTDENSIKYKETIPCVDGSGSTATSDDTCVGKDVAQINQGYTQIISIINSEDKAIIIQNINDADICSIRLLSYDQIIKLFKKIASDSNIADGKEKAIVKLVASIKSEKFNDFFTLVQADNNKILKNLMFKIDDKTFFYGANNYTNLVKLFLQMFNDVNKDILKGINADELKTYTVVQNSYFTPSNNEPIFHMYFQYDKPELQISQGVWEVTQNCNWVAESGGDGHEECTTSQSVKYQDPMYVNPFDMVVLASDSDYNLINGITDDNKKVTVIPAILLFYAHEKGQVENIKIYVQNTLDVVTLLVPVTKIATGPKWLAKTFTFVDKWSKVNAGVNLAVNNTPLNQIPEIKAALDAYNAVTAVMNVTSLAGAIGKGKIAKFFNEVDNPAAKQILLNQAKNGSDDAKKILDVEAELKAYTEAKEGKGWWKNLDDVDNGWQWANVSDYLISLQSNYAKVFNKVKNWPEDEVKRFMEDFPTESSLKLLNTEDDLIDVWRNVKYLKNDAKNINFLQWLKQGKESHLGIHLQGEVNSQLNAVGCHLQSAVDGNRVKILPNPPPIYAGQELVRAKIEISGVTKNALSTFFPKSWDVERVLEEVALIMTKPSNQVSGNIRKYQSIATDGITKIEVRLTGPSGNLNFDTAFPY
ncbi:hypothetical protein HHL23_20135 [Chryseobacterium sp. RP-3-3]|uniref:Fibronectin type-III domain-containing protein n=1 Tax=Chryseobacterium antibioticum TaxID=2728847 RepID=A0A7Y0ARK4_9FLAO|nr:fibronectin type III domain-containing protein [Chryseobacterium antibioticum]NML72080.1 hypothetical protein [Chryseobacterium antibioticum]